VPGLRAEVNADWHAWRSSPAALGRIPAEIILRKDLPDGAESGIFNSGGDVNEVTITHGRHDIGRGVPEDIWRHDAPLTNRQQELLDELPDYDSRVVVDKEDISMNDLSALTAKANVEFAMFTRGAERLVIRGDAGRVNINPNSAADLSALGYRWSGHTHPGGDKTVLRPSDGDRAVLSAFNQSTSVL